MLRFSWFPCCTARRSHWAFDRRTTAALRGQATSLHPSGREGRFDALPPVAKEGGAGAGIPAAFFFFLFCSSSSLP
jgi:hypothetical protein